MTQPAHSDRPRHRHYDADMLSVEDALARILSHFRVLEAEELPLTETLGQVLAEDVVSTIDIPPFTNSAMDGYAVRAADVAGSSAGSPVRLKVVGGVAAGGLPDVAVDPGTAVRIMTGAPAPDGADAVVPFEDTDELDRRKAGGQTDVIEIRHAAAPGDNLRAAGMDVARDAVVLSAGTVMRPGEIGVAASVGRQTLRVVRRPRVAIVATGDELLEPGETFRPGRIYNSNSYSVAALVRKYGGVPVALGIARDTVESLNAVLDEAVRHDFVITSAGVSKGDYDVVKDVLAGRGQIALWSVRMRPAKPLAFGLLPVPGGRPVPLLGLPGNPVSAVVAFEQFARPAILLMMGKKMLGKPTIEAIMDDAIVNHDGRRVYARVVVERAADGRYHAHLTGDQGSNILSSVAAANGFAICPEDRARVEAGQAAAVQMLDWPEEFF
ncbi:MAG: molybdopterin molybdotransferase MoeA [Chloroflexi bacterium]|nr:molybdopterin molybdotransferase MoeA [Chloroflexota bacterium]